jgi:hypothetical protein
MENLSIGSPSIFYLLDKLIKMKKIPKKYTIKTQLFFLKLKE